MNDLIAIAPDQRPIILNDADALETTIKRIEKSAMSEAPVMATAKGREAVKSLAANVARTKAPLRDAAKTLKEDAQATINKINGSLKIFESRMDDLRDKIRAPLTRYEDAEKMRKAEIIGKIEVINSIYPAKSSEDIQSQMGDLSARGITKDEFQEYLTEAEIAVSNTLARLMVSKDAAAADEEAKQKAEAQRIELEELRAKQAEIEAAHQKDREDREQAEQKIRDEAKVQHDELAAKLEASEKAREDAENAALIAASPKTEEPPAKQTDACPEAGGGDMAKTATPSSLSLATLVLISCGADRDTADLIMGAIILGDVPGTTFSEETK